MGNEKKLIIVPIDFGDQSLIALKQSFNLASLTNSELLLVNVIDDDTLKSFSDILSKDQNFERQLISDTSKKLKELGEQVLNDTGIKVNTEVKVGKVYEEIVHLASETKASLIVMGTQGPIGLKKRFLGSNASRVVRAAECPVITIKGKNHRPGCKNILLPLDLTKETKEKVNEAIELAKLFKSVIHIVTIVESNDEFIMNRLTRQMEQVKIFVENEGIACTTEFADGSDVAGEVIKTAQRVDADLIMVMTQKEVGWVNLFLAPAAQDIINLSEIPVLAIRPIKRKDTTDFIIT
jgi:nucleotide-binding universal stress UspA family protein